MAQKYFLFITLIFSFGACLFFNDIDKECNNFVDGVRPCEDCDINNSDHKACYRRTVDYEKMVQPIFDSHCIDKCHAIGESGWSATGAENIGLTLKFNEAPLSLLINIKTYDQPLLHPIWRVRSFEPDSSYLFTILDSTKGPIRIPFYSHSSQPISIENKEIIRKWILEGAYENL